MSRAYEEHKAVGMIICSCISDLTAARNVRYYCRAVAALVLHSLKVTSERLQQTVKRCGQQEGSALAVREVRNPLGHPTLGNKNQYLAGIARSNETLHAQA